MVLLAGAVYGGYVAYQHIFVDTSTEAARAPEPRPVIVEVAEAEMRTLRRTVEAVGTSRARRSVEITPLVSGRVTDLLIEFRPGRSGRGSAGPAG